jgi:hypothetical protein
LIKIKNPSYTQAEARHDALCGFASSVSAGFQTDRLTALRNGV